MNFSFHGLTLHISSGQVQYNGIRKPFYQYATEAVEKFEQLYCNNQTIETVVEDAPDQFVQSIEPVIGHCVDFLIQRHIYAVDIDTFWEKYVGIIDQWSKPYYAIADRVAEIRLNQEQLSEYRTKRRQLRGRVIGGGFGISGAVKGMAAAGAMNAVIGMGHMLFNGLGEIVTSISTASALRRIFEDPQTLRTLKIGVYHSAFGCHLALVDCCNQYLDMNIPVPSADDVQLSQNYGNNAARIVDPTEKAKLILSALELNPYEKDHYRALLDVYGDEKQELEQIAAYFGVDIGKIKSAYIEDRMSAPAFTNADAKEQKTILEQLIQHTKIGGPAAQPFQEKLCQLDKEARTVSGVTFDTLEEADESRTEKDALDAIIRNVHWDDRFSLQESISRIEKYHSPLARFLRARLLQQLSEIESGLCNIEMGWGEPPIRFPSLEASQKGLVAVNMINQRLKQSDLSDERTLLEICAWIEHTDFPSIVQKRYHSLIQGWIGMLHQQKNNGSSSSRSGQNFEQKQTAYSAKGKSPGHGCLKRIIAAIILLFAIVWVGGQILERTTAGKYITRAEFAQLLTELTPLNSNFSLDYSGVADVSQLYWARSAISACIENGVMLCEIYPDSGQAFFNPDDPLSKEALAYALSKVCATDSSDDSSLFSSTSLYNTDFPAIAYSDRDKANEAYIDAIDCMQYYQLIGTDEEGNYQPRKKITWTYVRDVLNRCIDQGYLAVSEPVDELLDSAHAPENYLNISACAADGFRMRWI